MVRRVMVWGMVGVGVWVGVGRAQEPRPARPAISIEAVLVNEIPIPNAPVKNVTVAIGDILTCKLYLRDWSPDGQLLRLYQIQLDANSFASGEQGVVEPVDYLMNPDKDPNAFVDEKDPEWVHRGRATIPIVDTVSPGYRFLSVLLEPNDGPKSAQDGKKYTCGTLRLRPSPNAKGTYTLGLREDSAGSYLINSDNDMISPIQFEKLTVQVAETSRWRRVILSDPADGAVDARRSRSSSGAAATWDQIKLRFNGRGEDPPIADFSIEDGSSSPPKIKKVTGDGSNVLVELDRGIRAGAWTTLVHKPSVSKIRFGLFPGDVSGDGKTDSQDVLTIIRALNGMEALPSYRSDIDGSGALDASDLLAVLDLVSQGSGPRTKSSAASSE